LVLFRDRKRIDFSFWQPAMLAAIVRGDKIYESYRNGYQVLVDKDHLAEQLPPPSGVGFSISPPGRETFRQTIYDFWFEAYCVARYLARRDLWFAKLIENRYIKDHLFRMALWNHQAAQGWQPNPMIHTEGKRFEKWAPAELVEALARGFSLYAVEDTWRSLYAMVEVFNRLARQTAGWLQIDYPDRAERDILDYLKYLRSRSIDREEKSR
jgi:aminoglycoside 6-adenylyltransferase